MASVETNKYDGRYLKLDVTQQSQSISGNYSTCKWTVSSIGGNSTYYAVYSASATVHGTVVWNVGTVGWNTKTFPAATGSTSNTFTVWHDNATGTASVGFSLTGGIWSSANVVTRSGTLTLDTIPRNPKISSFSTSAASETSINVSWSSDMTIDYLDYSINDGANWTRHDNSDGSSGSFTISGLSAGTTYNIKINLHSKASGLWSGASSRSARTTYSYPTATLPSGSVTLNTATKSVSFSFNNPLKRTISYSATCGSYSVSGSTTGTSASLNLDSDSLYNQISGTSGTLTVAASATGLSKTGSVTLYTDAGYAAPGINTNYFEWKAIHKNDAIAVGSGYMVQNLSYLQARYTSSSIITLRKGASSLKSVSLSFGGKTSTLTTTLANHNSTSAYNYTSATAATITVTDNRGYTASASVNIPFLPYANPTAGIEGSRVGGYGTTVDLNAKGYCSSLNNTNSITKIQCKYTYVYLDDNKQEKSEEIIADMPNGYLRVTQDNTRSTVYWVNVTDELGNTSGWQNCTTVIAGQPIFFIDEKLKGLGINCFPESDGLYINGKRQMQRFDIDLSSQSTSNFYPIVFEETQEFIHCEISSPSLGGDAPWNQNSINFTMKSCGWSDSPVDLIIHSYGRYTNGEVTIGCIGRGTSHGEVCIWLRGGMIYNFYSNVEATAHPTGFTSAGGEPVTFMQGTNYYGGSNTRTAIEFTPDSTIVNGAYFRNNLKVGGNLTVAGSLSIGGLSVSGDLSVGGGISCSNNISADKSLFANNGYLYSVCNGHQIRIGSRNSSWCHYETGAPAHWFNTNVAVAGTLFKGSGYDVAVPGVRISSGAPAATQAGDIWFIT